MKKEQKNDNIVLFPGSAQYLVQKGMQNFKEGKKEQALRHFQQALSHEKNHPEASYGLLLVYADMGKFHQGRMLAEKMLEEGIGEYIEVLRVYVSILAQLEEYETVVEILEESLEEGIIPEQMKEELEALLTLSKQIQQEETILSSSVPNEENPSSLMQEWKYRLKFGTEEQKLALIKELQKHGPSPFLAVIEEVLRDQTSPPLLQSLLLLLLKDWEVEAHVWVEKLERKGEFSPVSLPALEETTAYIQTAQLLRDVLEQTNPTLLTEAKRLLKQIVLYYYPFSPTVQIKSFACFIHKEMATLLGMEKDVSSLLNVYETDARSVSAIEAEYERIQTTLFQL